MDLIVAICSSSNILAATKVRDTHPLGEPGNSPWTFEQAIADTCFACCLQERFAIAMISRV
jgi:hypothetical protein